MNSSSTSMLQFVCSISKYMSSDTMKYTYEISNMQIYANL